MMTDIEEGKIYTARPGTKLWHQCGGCACNHVRIGKLTYVGESDADVFSCDWWSHMIHRPGFMVHDKEFDVRGWDWPSEEMIAASPKKLTEAKVATMIEKALLKLGMNIPVVKVVEGASVLANGRYVIWANSD